MKRNPTSDVKDAELLKRLRQIPGVQIGSGDKPQGASHPLRIKRGEKTLAEIVPEDRG